MWVYYHCRCCCDWVSWVQKNIPIPYWYWLVWNSWCEDIWYCEPLLNPYEVLCTGTCVTILHLITYSPDTNHPFIKRVLIHTCIGIGMMIGIRVESHGFTFSLHNHIWRFCKGSYIIIHGSKEALCTRNQIPSKLTIVHPKNIQIPYIVPYIRLPPFFLRSKVGPTWYIPYAYV